MAKTLVLAEKPSVARELARVLGCKQSGEGYLEGEKYIVTWALGHLVELAPPEDYDKAWAKWDMLTLPMLPERMKTVVIPQSGRQFRAVQAQLRRGDVGELVIATDAGREGELVARWILEKAGWKGPAKRLWISSQTDKAIREGFAHLRPAAEYDNLFRSARARSEADWLVGLNVTRALTCKYNAQLSAGRVQTPTLAIIVEREEAIRRFVPQEFWTVTAKLPGFTATWRDPNGQARLFDRERAEELAARLAGKEGVVTRLRRTRRQAPPPAAYDLTELQRDANKKYAYSAKETLAILQNLYEIHKVVTYPRTDSRYIPDDVVPTLPERLRSVMVEDYKPLAAELLRSRPLQTKYLVNAAKVTDHHALLPTEEPVELWRLTGPELAVNLAHGFLVALAGILLNGGNDAGIVAELVQDLLVRLQAQGPDQAGDGELAVLVDADPEDLVGVGLILQPGAPVGDDSGGEDGQVGLDVRLLAVVHTGGPDDLGNHDALGAVDNKGAGVGHQREVAHEDLLLLDLLGLLVPQADLHLQRRGVGGIPGLALLHVVLGRLIHLVVDEGQLQVALIVRDRAHVVEHLPEAGVQKLLVRLLLDLQKVGHGHDFLVPGEVLTKGLSVVLVFGHLLIHLSSVRPALSCRARGFSGGAARNDTHGIVVKIPASRSCIVLGNMLSLSQR
mgnify:CR=1 FL=1